MGYVRGSQGADDPRSRPYFLVVPDATPLKKEQLCRSDLVPVYATRRINLQRSLVYFKCDPERLASESNFSGAFRDCKL